MHNTFKDLIVLILNVLIQFVLVIILAKSGSIEAKVLALLVVGYMVFYIQHSLKDFVVGHEEDPPYDETGYAPGCVSTNRFAAGSDGGALPVSQEAEIEAEARHGMARVVAYHRYGSGEKPCFSTGICESLTAGYGECDSSGYWQFPLDVAQDGTMQILPFNQNSNET